MLLGNLLCAGANFLGCVMPNHWSYALTRMLGAAGGQGMFITAFAMVIELSGVKETVPGLSWVTWSTFLANVCNLPFSIGESIPPLIAMALPDWKPYQATLSSIILGKFTESSDFIIEHSI